MIFISRIIAENCVALRTFFIVLTHNLEVVTASVISILDFYVRSNMKSKHSLVFFRMPPRRLHKRPISATPYFNRVKNNKVEVEATNRSVPGDHFYIDDDGNMQPLEIGSIPNMQTFADSSVRSSGRLAVSRFIFCSSFNYFQ